MRTDLPITIPQADLELDTGTLYDKYERSIIDAFGWVESTQKSYRNTIDGTTLFLTDIPFCDCMTEDFDRAIEQYDESRVKSGKKPYSESTLKGSRSVFTDLCYFCEIYSKGLYSTVVWGSIWKSSDAPNKRTVQKKQEQTKESQGERIDRQVVLPRSFKLSEEIKLFDAIDKGIEKNSYYAGLALSFYLGLRPGECCGVTFGDIRPLAGYPEAYCLYIYEQIRVDEKSSNDLKTANAYRVLPIPAELYDLLSKRKQAVEKRLHRKCDDCYVICGGEDPTALQKQCNRRRFCIFAQTTLRQIKVDEHVLTDLSNELKKKTVAESNVTTYLLRRNFATALSGVCGMEDDELKYLMGHAIGSASEQRHDFVNPDTLFQLWEKMNLRTFRSNDVRTHVIDNKHRSLLLRQKKVNISIDPSAWGKDGVYLRVFNESPNDYIMVKARSDEKGGVMYRTALEPAEMKGIGRMKIHGEFAKAVQQKRKQLRNNPSE